jgi:hypothetical protein
MNLPSPMNASSRGCQHLVAALADPDPFPVFQHLLADPCLLIAFGANDHHVGNVQGGFLVHDASLRVFLCRPRMPFDEIDAFHDDATRSGVNLEYLPLFPLEIAGYNGYMIILDYLHSRVLQTL